MQRARCRRADRRMDRPTQYNDRRKEKQKERKVRKKGICAGALVEMRILGYWSKRLDD